MLIELGYSDTQVAKGYTKHRSLPSGMVSKYIDVNDETKRNMIKHLSDIVSNFLKADPLKAPSTRSTRTIAWIDVNKIDWGSHDWIDSARKARKETLEFERKQKKRKAPVEEILKKRKEEEPFSVPWF